MKRLVATFLTVSLLAVLVVLLSAPARATGTVLVRQRDGSMKTYTNVRIGVGNDQLELTSSDGQGTLVL
ncbi:MAG: hypothetical protein JO263_10905, partial [Candidatus Eremiobacteraeota bacterium]|nr:hypothetical protein [Candidatus Eremiobacteraeota bacterium]